MVLVGDINGIALSFCLQTFRKIDSKCVLGCKRRGTFVVGVFGHQETEELLALELIFGEQSD